MVSSNKGEVRYRVHTPCDVPVGSYQCHIRVPVSKNKSKGESVWEDSKQVVFLFNPWNKGNVDQLLLCSCLQSLLWLYDSLSDCQYIRVITVDVVEELCNLHVESLELVLRTIIHLYWYYNVSSITDDDVYISNDKERDEYINNETGLIWAGTARRTFTWPWNFAQVGGTGDVCH